LSNNFGGLKTHAEVLNATKSIEAMEKMIKPAIQQATDWSVKAGLGFVSASAFMLWLSALRSCNFLEEI
jgi:hypothetical protein